MTKQISVFSENKPGKLAGISKILKDNNINIRAIKISSSGDFGVVKLLVNKPELCYQKLREAGITAYLRDIIGIVIKDEPGGLFEISSILAKYSINIEDSYGFVIEDKKNAVLIIETADGNHLKEILTKEKISYLTGETLYN
ncbi:MAG TPA: ACT domain-containing protein [bacterium]|nr:ACT domain-containing protein [bacterium]HPN31262.1 ACT domain-containing protein [bacterium]